MQKYLPANLSNLLTKLCSTSKCKRLTPARKEAENPEEPPSEQLQLRDPLTGKCQGFNLYKDRDLPFMQKRGGLMARHIHDATADDDVQTDNECRENAVRCQKRSLRLAF